MKAIFFISGLSIKLFYCLIICVIFYGCNSTQDSNAHQTVKVFNLDDVTLLDGPFLHATELNQTTLIGYDPDRLLARFRIEAGLEPQAEPYGGWESQSLAGHTLGHYLSACAHMLLTTGDTAFLNRINYIVEELKLIQEANGGGYIGAFSDGQKIFEEELANGDIRPQSFNLNGIWAPFYTHHKVLAGLRDVHRLARDTSALGVASNFADWIYGVVSNLDTLQIQKMLECEHGGMNEVLVDLYADTGEEKYLEMTDFFHHKAVIDSLAKELDILPGIHGNTQIPKLIGVARRYQTVGGVKDYDAATFFWDRVVNHHSYVTGGHGNHEYFGQPDQLRNRLSSGTTESCNVYNMLKLTSILFELKPSVELADFYERALFNHILSSQHPHSGKVIYNLSLEMGGYKQYQDPEWFTCCVGTGMENHATHNKALYYTNESSLYVSQYIASELQWLDKGVSIRMTTQYPESENIQLSFEMEQSVEFDLNLRYPGWAERGMRLKVNDNYENVEGKPGSFIKLSREWRPGDKVEISIPFTIRMETMPDDSNRIAIMHGPLVLAGILGEVEDPGAFDDDYVPVIIAENRDPNKWLNTENGPNTFKTAGVGHPRQINFQPFYRTHDARYSVYWDLFDSLMWSEHLLELQEQRTFRKQLTEFALDHIDVGAEESEEAHEMQVENTNKVRLKNRIARQANRGGQFSYELGIDPDQVNILIIEYWGGYTGSKTFDILINDKWIATEDISSKKDGYFILERYPVPFDISKGKDKVRVTFLPHEGHRAGPIFEIFTLPEESGF